MSRAGIVLLLSALVLCFGERPTLADDDSAQYVHTQIVSVRPPFPPTDHTFCKVTDTSGKRIVATLHLYPLPPWTPPYRGTDQGGPFGLVPTSPFYVAEWPGGVTPQCWLVSSHYERMRPAKTMRRRRPK